MRAGAHIFLPMARTKTTPRKTSLFSCAVCITEMLELNAAQLECHPSTVCRPCLRKWFNESHTCPVCRTPVTSHQAVNGSVADYERAQRRQERRRERVRRAQMAHDAGYARRLQIQQVLDLRRELRRDIETTLELILVEIDEE